MMESLFVEFLLFFIANPVLVIWARIDATKVPDDSMFKAGEQLIWVIVFVFTGFIGRPCTSRSDALAWRGGGRALVVRGSEPATASSARRHRLGPSRRRRR
jgi:hypothetical protein